MLVDVTFAYSACWSEESKAVATRIWVATVIAARTRMVAAVMTAPAGNVRSVRPTRLASPES
jgi:hypothetical protein